jgi:hypothetical protein
MAMKWCINCDALFVPNPKESRAQWARRQFCSRRCATRWKALRLTTVPASGACEDCGVPTVGLREGRLCDSCWHKRRYRAQRERILTTNRAWREANPDYWRKPEIVARNKQWQREHPERTKEINNAARRRRRARLAGAAVTEVAATEQYIAILRADPCAYCGARGGEIDHIDAVSGGGGHVWHNMTSACRSCNAVKHDASLLTALLRQRPQTGQGVVPCCE